MTAKVKLSELVAARSGMSDPDHYIHREDASYRSFDIIGQDVSAYMDNSCDARGIVATVKAADVLIEIAQAALAWRRTDRSDHYAKNEALRRLDEALTKVEP